MRGELADRVFWDYAQALEAFLQVDGWMEASSIWSPMQVRSHGGDSSPRLRKVFGQVLTELETRLRQDPEHPAGEEWAGCSTMAGDPPGRMPQGVLPAPGRLWPRENFVQGGARAYLDAADWDGTLAFLAGAEARLPPEPLGPAAWKEAQAVRTVTAMVSFRPSAPLGRHGG